MLGFRYVKGSPADYYLLFRGGRVVREGAGIYFFYFAPTSTVARIPISSQTIPFVFTETSLDFQEITIQGELTYRIAAPKQIASVLDFTLDSRGYHRSEDPTKIGDRLIAQTQVLTRAHTQNLQLRDILIAGEKIVAQVSSHLAASDTLSKLGLELVNLTLVSIKATPEMAKAFQAEAREALLKKADEAVYARRNAAVEMERTIKENELNTELAVEQKKRQIRQSQMDAEIAVEQQRATLVESRVANEKLEAQAKAEAMTALIEPLKSLDWRTLLAMQQGHDSSSIISMAFQELAANAGKIGELNITPDLLANLTKGKGKG